MNSSMVLPVLPAQSNLWEKSVHFECTCSRAIAKLQARRIFFFFVDLQAFVVVQKEFRATRRVVCLHLC